MREESNRMIQNMERNRQAEKEQRDRELQAIEEDNAYRARIEQENFQIETQNLQAERNEAIRGIQVQQAEANAESAKTQSVLNVIGTLSKTAGQLAQTVDAELLKQDTAKATAAALQYTPDRDKFEERIRGEALRAQGTIQLNANVTANDAQSNAPPVETAKSLVSNPGLTGRAKQIYDNLIVSKSYSLYYNQRTADAEYKYTAADGRQFTGADAQRDVYFSGELRRITLTDIMRDMGITDPMYLTQAQQNILQFDQTVSAQVSKEQFEQTVEIGLDQASQLMSSGTTDDLYVGFDHVSRLIGKGGAHDMLQKVIENPNTSQETVDNIGNLVFDGKKYSEGWKDNRWLPSLQKRQQNIIKADTADFKLRQDIYTNKVLNSIDEVSAFIDEDPYLHGKIVADDFLEQGFPVPTAIKNLISSAVKENDETIATMLSSKFQDNIIDDNFINSLPTAKHREQARELKEEQETRKFGPNYAGLKKNLIGDARQLTSINPGGANTSQTYLVYGRAVQEYQGFIDQGFTPEEAVGRVNAQIQEARSGTAGATNPFYFVSGENNRRTFPNIETSGVEREQRRNVVDKRLLTYGVGILDEPYVTATAQEMDATYESHLAGNTIYPPEILRVAKMFGIKPSEAYNTVRKAQNAVTGENKPLLKPSSVTQLIDEAPTLRYQRMLQSGNTSQVKRAGAGMGITGLPRRASMGGATSSQRDALMSAASELGVSPIDLATIIGFETAGTYDPNKVGGQGNNYQGLIQFGIPERTAYGVTPGMTFEEQLRGPVVRFFKDRFNKAGMDTQGADLLQLYTTVLAGNPGANPDAPDSFGTTARNAVNPATEKGRIMAQHREAARKRFGL
jgi:hypothetical protein